MDKLIESFEKLAANYGPTVIDAATGAARMEGISYLFSSVIWLGLAYGAYLLSGMLRKSDEEFARFRVVFPGCGGFVWRSRGVGCSRSVGVGGHLPA
mgnify:CR=1 FL=1